MKTLYIIRHAKSSWDDPTLDDFDRPLNDRGHRNAPRMGKRLKEREIYPDHILSSTALRAKTTAEHIAIALGFDVERIALEDKLYHADRSQILHAVKQMHKNHNSLFLVGHNPGLTDFSNAIRNDGKEIFNIPTCGILALRFDIPDWKDLTWHSGEPLFYDYTKNKS